MARERTAARIAATAETARLVAENKTLQDNVDKRFEAARDAGRLVMVMHPGTGLTIPESEFKKEAALRHTANLPPMSFWTAPLPASSELAAQHAEAAIQTAAESDNVVTFARPQLRAVPEAQVSVA